MAGEGANALPRDHGEDNGENQEKKKGEPPQLALAFFKLCEAIVDRRASFLARRRPLRCFRGFFLALCHSHRKAAGRPACRKRAEGSDYSSYSETVFTNEQQKGFPTVPEKHCGGEAGRLFVSQGDHGIHSGRPNGGNVGG